MRPTVLTSVPSGPSRARRASRLAALAAATLAAAPSAGAQVMQFFGDWVAPGAVEIYVSNNGSPANPGTLAAPLRTITSAVALAAGSGALGAVPVTINVLNPGPGVFDVASGEAFPIALPAHGISIEAYSLTGGQRPIVDASGSFARDTFLFNALGNPALPDSVLRGLEIRNSFQIANSTEVRVEVPLGAAPAPQRAAPEIRFCTIIGTAGVGVDLVSTAGVQLEAVVERNTIEFQQNKFSQGVAGVRVTGGVAPCTPLIRANDVVRFPINVSLFGGGLTNQPRVQANFIHVGGTNVRCEDCAPFIVGNTIAFAFRAGTLPIGVEWVNVPEMTLANNLIWNPFQPGLIGNPIDVQGPMNIFVNADRTAWFNFDEDDILVNTSGWPNFGPGSFAPFNGPDLVGGDTGAGLGATDLHLNPTSVLRELGISIEAVPSAIGFPNPVVPGAPAAITVRRDHALDFDHDARISGFAPDLGADEVTALFGPAATSGTRAATLAPRIGSVTGSDLDAIGNLTPTPAGQWATEVEIQGTPGDLVMLISGVGFNDLVPDPMAPGVLVENTAVYQNVLGDASVLPGMVTQTSVSVDLTGGSVTVGFAVVPAAGPAVFLVNFGAVNPAFFEAEAHLQAIAFDPSFTLVQASNRLSLDLNE